MDGGQELPDPKKITAEEEGLCPTCGYFVGIAPTCPRCGARPKKRIAVRAVRFISVIGSFIGIVLLWYAAYTKNAHDVKVTEIDEQMNGALVKVAGRVSSYEENLEKNTLKLKIDDGTGEIMINAYNKLAAFKKVLKDGMPRLGDEVEISGVISENQTFGISMFLSVPERVKVTKKYELKDVRIGDLTRADVAAIVRITAVVVSYKAETTKRGAVLHKFVLGDGTGVIDMTLFDKQFTQMAETPKKLLTEGKQQLKMVIRISEYRGVLQANLVNPDDVASVGEAPADLLAAAAAPGTVVRSASKGKRNIGDLVKSDIDGVYDFTAEIRDVEIKSKGMLLTLGDGTGSIKVLLWHEYREQIPFDKLREGAKVKGPFIVAEFRGDLQLKVENPALIQIE